MPKLTRGLRAKLDTLMEALNEQFGTAAEFEDPKGGIFLWVKLPDNVDTMKLYQAALAAGVAINPGPEWSTDKAYGSSRLRLCFASPTHEQIREGVAALAEVCRRNSACRRGSPMWRSARRILTVIPAPASGGRPGIQQRTPTCRTGFARLMRHFARTTGVASG